MNITSDFECGNGKNFKQISDHHWRMEAVSEGQRSNRGRYFFVRIDKDENDEDGEVLLEVYSDSDMPPEFAKAFMGHYPSQIWCRPVDTSRWYVVQNQYEHAVEFFEDHIEIRYPIEKGHGVYFASNIPAPYSEILESAKTLEARMPNLVNVESIGSSTEGRSIPVIRISNGRDRKFLCIAGQDPCEHGGVFACRGIADWLVTNIAAARRACEQFEFAIIPIINPDGNVKGLNFHNTAHINLYSDFKDAWQGNEPTSAENKALWRWCANEFQPDVMINFHSFLGKKQHTQYPFDGLYRLKDAASIFDQTGYRLYEVIQEHLLFETQAGLIAPGMHGMGSLGDAGLEYNLAKKFGTLSGFYELNCGYTSNYGAYRRGPEVLSTVLRALERQ